MFRRKGMQFGLVCRTGKGAVQHRVL